MKKMKFAVIGHPISHTKSPFIHRKLFQFNNIQAEYTAIDIYPQVLEEEFERTLSKLNGYNVTIPYKTQIIPFLETLDQTAQGYGSVNTVKENKKGYSTDGIGFLRAIESENIKLTGKTVILGAGGVARVFLKEALNAGADVMLAVREESKEKARENFGTDVKILAPGEVEGEIDLLINATPVGMYPNNEDVPLSRDFISRCSNVFDSIYNPSETRLLQIARSFGAKTCGGMGMLVWQAASAQEIWLDVKFKSEDIAGLIRELST